MFTSDNSSLYTYIARHIYFTIKTNKIGLTIEETIENGTQGRWSIYIVFGGLLQEQIANLLLGFLSS